MDEMENKLNSILGNPQMMQQIMAMAQAMGQQDMPKQEEKPPEPPPQPKPQSVSTMPAMPSMQDAAMLQRIAGIARQSGIDKNQQALLKALGPYLSRDRITKLERAMRAAKIAAFASTALGSGSFPFFSGR